MKEAARLDPANGRLAFWVGIVHYELRQDEPAVAALEQAARLKPDDAEIHRWLANAYQLRGSGVRNGLLR